MTPHDPLAHLTREVARTLGDGPDPHRRARQRRAVARLSAPVPTDKRWWWLVPIAAAAILVLFAVRPQPARDASPINATGPAVGAAFVAADTPISLAFPDHSRLALAPGGAARLVAADPSRTMLALEHGQLDLTVTPDPTRTWQVTAGPYTVDVTGTHFTVDWQPTTATLAVAVTTGSVHVRGGTLDAAGTHLSPGQRLVTTPAPAPAPPPSPPAATRARPSPPTWRSLAAAGDHTAALAAAERDGYPDLLAHLGVADLERLAQAARLAGAAAPARDALQALRRRFPDDPRAATATFLLGRVALDLKHDPPTAITWFTTYIQSHPEAPLAEEARGRLLVLRPDRSTATDYLQHHPDGSRAALARNILGPP